MAVSQTRIHMIGSTISNWCYNNNGHFFIRTNESTGCILIVWWASASNDWGTHFLRTTLLFLRKISLIYTPQPLSRSLLRMYLHQQSPRLMATPFPYSIVVKADNFGDLSKIVTFTAMAEDDCSSVSTISLNQDSGIKAVNMIFQLKLGAPCHCHY